MPATAAAPARSASVPELAESTAREIIGALQMLVAASQSRIAPGQVLTIPYTVTLGKQSFTFAPQPFYVLRAISKLEYIEALPKGLRRMRFNSRYYYEIQTD